MTIRNVPLFSDLQRGSDSSWQSRITPLPPLPKTVTLLHARPTLPDSLPYKHINMAIRNTKTQKDTNYEEIGQYAP